MPPLDDLLRYIDNLGPQQADGESYEEFHSRVLATIKEKFMIKLGDKVKDTVTGFVGTATQRVEYLHSVPRIYVEAKLAADGRTRAEYVEESRLEIFEYSVGAGG